MNATTRKPVEIVKTAADTFDTTRIVTTMNRLINETAGADGTAEVVDVAVLGHEVDQPARVHIVSKVVFKECCCTAAIPSEVDAGALRGLEAGIATD